MSWCIKICVQVCVGVFVCMPMYNNTFMCLYSLYICVYVYEYVCVCGTAVVMEANKLNLGKINKTLTSLESMTPANIHFRFSFTFYNFTCK